MIVQLTAKPRLAMMSTSVPIQISSHASSADLLNEHLLPIAVMQRMDTAIEILLEKPAKTILADSLISDGKIAASPRRASFSGASSLISTAGEAASTQSRPERHDLQRSQRFSRE
jgi:hypothetical protein